MYAMKNIFCANRKRNLLRIYFFLSLMVYIFDFPKKKTWKSASDFINFYLKTTIFSTF